jgi:hypothetical protein
MCSPSAAIALVKEITPPLAVAWATWPPGATPGRAEREAVLMTDPPPSTKYF